MPTYSRTDAKAAAATSRNILHLTPHMRVERIDEEEEILIFSATATGADRLRGLERLEPHYPHSAKIKMRNTTGHPSSPAPVSTPAREQKHVG
jgi:hypothetical protein